MTPQALALLVVLADEVPDDENVVAGWTAFAVFIALGIAVAILGFSLTKRLRNVERSEGEGRYGPSSGRRPPTDEATPGDATPRRGAETDPDRSAGEDPH